VVDVGPLSGTLPDLLRLATVPVFGVLAYRDIQTRRIDSITWVPLTLLGVLLLGVEWQRAAAAGGTDLRVFVLTTAISVGFVVSMAYVFHFLGAFGGADARALMTIAVLYPSYPGYVGGEVLSVAGVTIPVGDPAPVAVLSFTILTNAVAWGIAYPLLLAARNGAMGHVSKRMFVGIRVRWDAVPETHGKLLDSGSKGLGERLRALAYPRGAGLDLDAVRMYLRWRGATLAELRDDPERFRDPDSLPEEPNDPTDGAVDLDVATDGGEPEDDVEPVEEAVPVGDGIEPPDDDSDNDPWGAATFLDAIESDAYGTSPERLRDGLDRLTTEEQLWITPGIPFLVPVFLGLVAAFVYGDLLVGLLRALGLI
jgi:preflagellin peptidase FlaK